MDDAFRTEMADGYALDEPAVMLGSPLIGDEVLDLNETQTSILSLVFRYCDDQDMALLNLADLRTTLNARPPSGSASRRSTRA